MFKAIVILCLALALSLDVSGSEDNFAVDLETKLGSHYQLPYFPNLKSIDIYFMEEFWPWMLSLRNYVARLCNDALVPDDSTRIGKIRTYFAGLNSNTMRKLMRRNDKTMGPWYKATGDFFKQVLEKAVTISNELESSKAEKDEKQLTIDIRNQYIELKEAAAKSPSVALFVDWSHGKVKGRPAIDFYAELVGRFRYEAGEKPFRKFRSLLNTALDLQLDVPK